MTRQAWMLTALLLTVPTLGTSFEEPLPGLEVPTVPGASSRGRSTLPKEFPASVSLDLSLKPVTRSFRSGKPMPLVVTIHNRSRHPVWIPAFSGRHKAFAAYVIDFDIERRVGSQWKKVTMERPKAWSAGSLAKAMWKIPGRSAYFRRVDLALWERDIVEPEPDLPAGTYRVTAYWDVSPLIQEKGLDSLTKIAAPMRSNSIILKIR